MLIHLFKRKPGVHVFYIVGYFVNFFRNCPDPNPRGSPHCDPRGGVLLQVWIPHYITVHSGVYTESEKYVKICKNVNNFVSFIKSY